MSVQVDRVLLSEEVGRRFRQRMTTTGAIDREVATAMLVAAYRTCYLEHPDYVIWVASPLAGAYAVGLVPLFDALARRMNLSSADARAIDAAPIGLARQVAAAVNAQCRGSARAFPRDRQVPADIARWNAVSSRAVSEIGSAGFDEIYWGAYDDAFSSNDHCVSRQLDRDLPDDWFTYRDSTAVGGVFDGIVIDVLREAGVAGLDDWVPFSAAGALIDHYWMRPGCLVICDPPVSRLLDEQTRPHAERMPALRWRDGWEIFAHHGLWGGAG